MGLWNIMLLDFLEACCPTILSKVVSVCARDGREGSSNRMRPYQHSHPCSRFVIFANLI